MYKDERVEAAMQIPSKSEAQVHKYIDEYKIAWVEKIPFTSWEIRHTFVWYLFVYLSRHPPIFFLPFMQSETDINRRQFKFKYMLSFKYQNLHIRIFTIRCWVFTNSIWPFIFYCYLHMKMNQWAERKRL